MPCRRRASRASSSVRSPRRTHAGRACAPPGRCSTSAGNGTPSQYSARHATTSRTPVSVSHRTVPSVHEASRRARAGGISSGPSRASSRGRPRARARPARRSGVVSPRSAGKGARSAATARAARASARPAASATDTSSSRSSDPRSHSVGCPPRSRRAASAASSVVRPLPGGPTRPRTAAGPAVKALNSAATAARSTGSGRRAGPSCATDVPVSSSTPARLRSAP